LRGFGKWWQEGKKDIDFHASEEDIVHLSTTIKEKYPSIPLFVLGESLGGNIAIKLVCQYPNMFNGLILSGAAIERHPYFPRKALLQIPDEIIHPKKLRDISLFIRHFVSSNQQITSQILDDPLVRKQASGWELILSKQELSGAMQYADKIPPSTPVLFLQGGKDKNLKLEAMLQFCLRLRSQDQTIRWFPGEGHVLLETSYSSLTTLRSISEWLSLHTSQQNQLTETLPVSTANP
jgi:acylglycerol lipase